MGFKEFLAKESHEEKKMEVSTPQRPMVVVLEEQKAQEKDGIFLNVAQVGYLNGLFGLPVKSAEDLLDKVRRTQEIRFIGQGPLDEGLELIMEPEDLWAIKQQAIGMGRPFKEYAKEFVEDCISKELHGCVKSRW